MPNMRGGKAYKKGKKSAPSSEEVKFLTRSPGQEYARVTKLLGDRRVICFCNDGVERICKIRGSLCNRKSPVKQRIYVGDIVLISFREFSSGAATTDEVTGEKERKEILDLIYKYEKSHWKYIRKDPPIHKHLLILVGAGESAGDEEDIFDHDDTIMEEEAEAESNASDNDDDLDIDAI